jgi:hypothetical protein
MWKDTTTLAKGRQYHYRKLYVYHNKTHGQKWCYLKAEHIKMLGADAAQSTTQNATQNRNAPKRVALDKRSLGRELNPRPTAYKAVALPTELSRHSPFLSYFD